MAPTGRDERGLTLSLRIMLRLHIELREAYDAGDRIGEPPTFKEAIRSPHVVEQVAYLDIFARELMARYADDEEGLLAHLDRLADSDMEAIDQFREKLAVCDACGQPLCPDCQVCHSCKMVEEHTTLPKKKNVLN